jgi:hypothetical protein
MPASQGELRIELCGFAKQRLSRFGVSKDTSSNAWRAFSVALAAPFTLPRDFLTGATSSAPARIET